MTQLCGESKIQREVILAVSQVESPWGVSHPDALTEPCVNLAAHTALTIRLHEALRQPPTGKTTLDPIVRRSPTGGTPCALVGEIA